jgi:hypothetical protein
MEKDLITSWDSPRMLSMKQKWNLVLDDADKNSGSEKQGDKNATLGHLRHAILKELSMDDMRHLASNCNMLPVHEKDPNAFEDNVLKFMVVSFIDLGERDNLATLLSTRFPEYVGPETTTAYYLLHSPKKAIKDPVLILGEAYLRCKKPEVRHDIATVIRVGFKGFNIFGKDDMEFVTNSMQWYEKEKTHLALRETFTEESVGAFFQKTEAPLPTATR